MIKNSLNYFTRSSVLHFLEVISSEFYKVIFIYIVIKIIPKELISIFDPTEFEMILNGLPFINVDDWEANSVYKGVYNA